MRHRKQKYINNLLQEISFTNTRIGGESESVTHICAWTNTWTHPEVESWRLDVFKRWFVTHRWFIMQPSKVPLNIISIQMRGWKTNTGRHTWTQHIHKFLWIWTYTKKHTCCLVVKMFRQFVFLPDVNCVCFFNAFALATGMFTHSDTLNEMLANVALTDTHMQPLQCVFALSIMLLSGLRKNAWHDVCHKNKKDHWWHEFMSSRCTNTTWVKY